ncbi:cytochrome P450 PksS [Thermosporothrix hazakensis]|jgi:cytochrome P450|uniref:Cytochrome P450 PksS n=2 Tax=Thermosporothrix hazakensis TaxID=644383 RepID=A0A326U9N1_THEHA|nr:cytochrome P450 PksS [Thermosporothrix hazakensis]
MQKVRQKKEKMRNVTVNDLFSLEAKRDPIRFYKQLREQGPIIDLGEYPSIGKFWLLTRYEDAIALLKDPHPFTRDRLKLLSPEEKEQTTRYHSALEQYVLQRRDMLAVDPPDHTRLRKLVAKAFTPRMIEQMRPRMQQIVDELINAVEDKGKIELISEFAYPLPITVICEMLGIPARDRQQFRHWTQLLIVPPQKPEEFAALNAPLEEFISYIQRLIEEKHQNPGDDIISVLVQAREQEDKLSENELISSIFLLIVAGHETTVNLIANGVLELLLHPDQLQLLQQDPSLLPSTIEELLRYTGPIFAAGSHWAMEDTTLYGKQIRKGDIVLVGLTAANLDPDVFEHPEKLDITREENKHVAFGKGIHVCLGAPLARQESQIAIGTLIRRLPHLRLAVPPEQLVWSGSKFRALRSLPLEF